MVLVSIVCSMCERFTFFSSQITADSQVSENKQTKITHEFIDSVSGVDVKPSSVPASFILSGYFVSSSLLALVRPIFLAQECTECPVCYRCSDDCLIISP